MKKPTQNAALRRAFQKNATKKTGVHPAPEPNGPTAKQKRKRKLEPGQPAACSRLTTELAKKICGYVSDGLTWENAARACGIHRSVISEWKGKGSHDPASAYGKFLEAAEIAEAKREALHVKFIAQSGDWKSRRWLLCCWHPDRYKNTFVSAELYGPDHMPLIPAAENSFAVLIDLHPQEQNEPEPEFMIVDVDGKKQNGADYLRMLRSNNGQSTT
jgi:hypothetical protein